MESGISSPFYTERNWGSEMSCVDPEEDFSLITNPSEPAGKKPQLPLVYQINWLIDWKSWCLRLECEHWMIGWKIRLVDSLEKVIKRHDITGMQNNSLRHKFCRLRLGIGNVLQGTIWDETAFQQCWKGWLEPCLNFTVLQGCIYRCLYSALLEFLS